MADGQDRYEQDGNGVSFVLGLLTGAVIGAGIGLLFAPKAGAELRDQLSEQAGSLANQASKGVRKATESAGAWADRGREMYGKAMDAAVKGADAAQTYARDASASAASSAAHAADAVSAAAARRS